MLAALVAGVGTALILLLAVNPKPPPDPSFLVQLARLDRARDLLYIHWPLYSLVTCITMTALGETIAHRQERKGIPRTKVGRFVSITLLDLLMPAGCMLGLLINRDYVAARVITAFVEPRSLAWSGVCVLKHCALKRNHSFVERCERVRWVTDIREVSVSAQLDLPAFLVFLIRLTTLRV